MSLRYCCILVVLPLILLTTSAPAQVSPVWTKFRNGSGNGFDQIYAMTLDAEGNIYVAGSTYSGAATGVDFCTIKYDSNGDSVWVRVYNGIGNNTDIARSIAVDKFGNVVVAGESRRTSSSGSEDFLTIRYRPNGDSSWTRRYNGPGNGGDFPTSVGVDDSGNVYVSGGGPGSGTGFDITTIKYDSSGNEKWVKRFEGSASFGFSDHALQAVVDSAGNTYVAGYADNLNSFWDFTTIKYDRDGGKAWHAHYAGPLNNVSEQAETITIDDSGNVYIAGSSNALATDMDIVTIKYNAAGQQQWLHRFASEGAAIDDPRAIAVDAAGNVYVAGEGKNDYVLIKYSPAGDSLWARWMNGTANQTDQIYSIALNQAGDIYVTGRSGGSGSSYDIVTVKYNASGDSLWGVRYNGAGNFNDEATAIRIDASGYIYIAGMSTGSGTSGDFYLAKYSEEPATSAPRGEQQPAVFRLNQNYPNPFNPTTTLEFSVSHSGPATMKIYSVLGQELATLFDGSAVAGQSYRARFDAANFPAGIYFARLESGGNHAVRKIVLVK